MAHPVIAELGRLRLDDCDQEFKASPGYKRSCLKKQGWTKWHMPLMPPFKRQEQVISMSSKPAWST